MNPIIWNDTAWNIAYILVETFDDKYKDEGYDDAEQYAQQPVAEVEEVKRLECKKQYYEYRDNGQRIFEIDFKPKRLQRWPKCCVVVFRYEQLQQPRLYETHDCKWCSCYARDVCEDVNDQSHEEAPQKQTPARSAQRELQNEIDEQ